MIAKLRGTIEDERSIHRALAAERLQGEWFNFSPRVRAFIVRIAEWPAGEALEYAQGELDTECPAEWDALWVAEAPAHWLFSLKPHKLLIDARRGGSGPEYVERPFGRTGRVLHRYYRLSGLKRWLVANGIAHALISRHRKMLRTLP